MKKTGWGGAGQCQEAREDRTVTFTDVPPGVKVWSWNLWSGRAGKRARRLSGPQCSQLKQCQPEGFQLEGGHWMPSWPGRPPWNSSPLQAQPRSQVSSVLWQRWDEGLLRGHEGNTPTALSAGKEAGERAGLGWEKAQTMATESRSSSRRKSESIKEWNRRVARGFGWCGGKRKKKDDLSVSESTDGKKKKIGLMAKYGFILLKAGTHAATIALFKQYCISFIPSTGLFRKICRDGHASWGHVKRTCWFHKFPL